MREFGSSSKTRRSIRATLTLDTRPRPGLAPLAFPVFARRSQTTRLQGRLVCQMVCASGLETRGLPRIDPYYRDREGALSRPGRHTEFRGVGKRAFKLWYVFLAPSVSRGIAAASFLSTRSRDDGGGVRHNPQGRLRRKRPIQHTQQRHHSDSQRGWAEAAPVRGYGYQRHNGQRRNQQTRLKHWTGTRLCRDSLAIRL
jgi:hypothetical protein